MLVSMTGLDKKVRPTNADLQDQVAEVHDCLHQLARTVNTDRRDSKSRDTAIEGRLNAIDIRQARQEASLDLLVKFFRLDKGEPSPGIFTMKWWQAAIGIVCSVLGAMGAWKYLWPALVALHHAILAGH